MTINAGDLITRGQRYINSIGVRVEDNDWLDFISTAVNKLKRGRTLPWQKKETDIDLYTDIFKNPLPSDFESFIKPTTPLLTGSSNIERYWWNNLTMLGQGGQTNNLNYGKEIDFYRNFRTKFALTNDLGTPYLLSRVNGTKDLMFENFSEAITDDTSPYTLGGDASNAVSDDANFREGSSSLRFDIADSTNSSTITRTKGSGDIIDISDYINLGIVSLFVYMPAVITNISIKYGSDSSNYYSISAVTTQYHGASFEAGWNILSFDMREATSTGTPVDAEIKYYEISINNAGVTDNNFRIDGLYFRLPTNYRLPYNSNNNYQSSGGTAKSSLTNVSDKIIWDALYEDVLLYEIVKQAGGIKFKDADIVSFMDREFSDSLKEFNRRYPSNESPVSSRYYRRINSF